ncbi:response regulator [Mucisphaera sp.]|uniref:response regulator n=1 Tax=Mucisphaera sp. TaxID=2913024 RepID=UPI003D100AF5
MSGRRVIVADDERHITRILAFRLKQSGLEVETACHGREALEKALANPPDLVVSDYQMPEMNGLELAIALAEAEATAEVPVIVLTARSHRLTKSELVQTNVQALLDKPLSGAELDETVREILGLDKEVAAEAA